MTPTRFVAKCHFCKQPVDTRGLDVYQFMAGWAQNRTGGGARSVLLPKRENFWSCSYCIKQQSSGAYGTKDLFKEEKAAVAKREPKPTNAAYDESNMLTHCCNVCGGDAAFGIGVALRQGDLGLWYCRRHRPREVMQ